MKAKSLALLAATLAAGVAHADQTVTFNIQLNLTKLDAQVTAVGLQCRVLTQDKSTVLAQSPSAPLNPQPVGAGGSFSGSMSVPVTVPADKIAQTKAWVCMSQVRGPNSQWATFGAANSPAWAQRAPAPGYYYAEGNF